jgi:hypothetical protein
MNRVFSAATLLLALASSALADGQDGKDNKARKDALPRASTVKFDVTVFEDFAAYEVVKREVKEDKVRWVLENKRDQGTEITFGYQLPSTAPTV